jgi:anti-sigma B factor antagonist
MLDIAIDKVDDSSAVVTITGKMTLGSRMREVEAKLDDLASHGTRLLVLDMAGVEYVDSAGLGVLMLLYGRMKTLQGRFALVAPNANVMKLLQLTSTDKILGVFPDRAAALAG